LATKSYSSLIKNAQDQGYFVSIVFFWLKSPELAVERVKKRVTEVGHHIPEEVIKRRYHRGLINLFNLYIDLADYLLIFDNSGPDPKLIAEKETKIKVIDVPTFEAIKSFLS